MQDIPPKGGGTPVPPEFYENIDNLCDLLRKQIKLYGELKRSCRIADLLGVPPKELKGKIGTRVHAIGVSTFRANGTWTSSSSGAMAKKCSAPS